MKSAPWTNVGRLESDIQQIKNDVRNKADNYELTSINSRLDDMERSIREVRTEIDGILSKLQQLQENRGR